MKATQKGTAIVEFALVLPLLLLLTMITTEFGRAIYQYNTIVKSLRDGTRYLSVQTPNTKIAEAKNLVVFGNIAGTGQALVPGLTVAKVVIPPWQTVGSNPVINTEEDDYTSFRTQTGLGGGAYYDGGWVPVHDRRLALRPRSLRLGIEFGS